MDHTLDRRSLAASTAAPRVREVAWSRPLHWLRLGVRDAMRMPQASLGMGVLVATIGLLLASATWKAAYIAPALLGGFLLVGPFLAILLYGLSRQIEAGLAPDPRAAWSAMRGNAGSIALFGLVLVLAYVFWERSAAILFALHYDGQAVQLSQLLAGALAGQYLGVLLPFAAAGALVAAAVFALGVVSAPMLVDRPVDVVTAALTSLRCCARNPGAMLLWAGLIAGLTLAGFATLMLGLVLVFPLLAHASWHAYRDLVED